jgi:hypothetical protein
MMFAPDTGFARDRAVASDGDKGSAAAGRAEKCPIAIVRIRRGKGTDGFQLPGREEDRALVKPSVRRRARRGGTRLTCLIGS